MKYAAWEMALALSTQAVAFRDSKNFKRAVSDDGDIVPASYRVPSYNTSMPLDHFNSSDTRTFSNRFFVNDTYYEPGGPVILYDWGEAGITNFDVAGFLAEFNGTISAPLEVAKSLHGVVIAWEHRYYGTSRPFPVVGDGSSLPTSSLSEAGLPYGGPREYAFLTAEQALEDVVHFASNVFNQTVELGGRNTVLVGPKATRLLDPYHTPWIFIGASYPGNRAAWSRLRSPHVFYAAWSSSAPVNIQVDGSAYFNSIYRALPKNCTADMQSVARYVDDVLSSDDADAILDLKASVYLGSTRGSSSDDESIVEYASNATEADVANNMFPLVSSLSQSYGISGTTQQFCNFMESFEFESYLANASISSTSRIERAGAFRYNQGNSKPLDSGIVAYYNNITTGHRVGLAAYLYGVQRYLDEVYNPIVSSASRGSSSWQFADLHSWEWQVMTELGILPANNASSPLSLGSKFLNYTAYRKAVASQYFPSKFLGVIPDTPNQKFLEGFKGWNLQPSNTMFTNGEFDPWRAFSVSSLEAEDLGAPQRKISRDIPQCGKTPEGTDVFGILYGGAKHGEDMLFDPVVPQGSFYAKDNLPVLQGSKLFIESYKAWLPCFNDSRNSNTSTSGGGGSGDSGDGGGDKSVAHRSIVTSVGLREAFTALLLYSVYLGF